MAAKTSAESKRAPLLYSLLARRKDLLIEIVNEGSGFLFSTSRATALIGGAREIVESWQEKPAGNTEPERQEAIATARGLLHEANVLLKNHRHGKSLLLAANAAEIGAHIGYTEGSIDSAIAVLMGSASVYFRAEPAKPNDDLARIALAAARWYSRMGCFKEAAGFGHEFLEYSSKPASHIDNVAYVCGLAEAAGNAGKLAELARIRPARSFAEPFSSLLTIVEHRSKTDLHHPQILLKSVRRLAALDVDLHVQCGLYVVSDFLARDELDMARTILAELLDRASPIGGSHLIQARLLQAQAHVAARQKYWSTALEAGLAAWTLFEETLYHCGLPQLRRALHRSAGRARHSAMRAAVELGDARLLLELIEAVRLQASIDIVGSVEQVEGALAGRPVKQAPTGSSVRTIDPSNLPPRFAIAVSEMFEDRSDLGRPLEITVAGISKVGQSRRAQRDRTPFAQLDRPSVEATDLVERVAAGQPHYWWSCWYEEGSVFSALARDGTPVGAWETVVADDAELQNALTCAIAGYAMPVPWPAAGDADIDVEGFLADCESPAELAFTEPLTRLLPEELISVQEGQERQEDSERLLLISCAPELAGVPWPILPLDLGARPVRRLVENFELRFLPSMAALTHSTSASERRRTPLPFLLSCDYLPGDRYPVRARDALAVFGPPAQQRRSDRVQAPTLENIVVALRSIGQESYGLAFFRCHYRVQNGDPASSGIVLQGGFPLQAGMLGVVLREDSSAFIPMPVRAVLSCCASSGTQDRNGGEALGMAAMCMKAGARQVIATSVEIQQCPFTNELDDMLVELGLTAQCHFSALRELHLALLAEWRCNSGATPHIWAHYQAIGFE